MGQGRYPISTATTGTSLIPGKSIFLFTLVLCVVLAALFQHRDRLTQLFTTSESDSLSVAYLRALAKMQPHDTDLHLHLARQLGEMALWDAAYETLDPMLGDTGTAHWPGQRLLLEIKQRQLYSLAGTSAHHATLKTDIEERLAAIAQNDIPGDQLEALASLALAVSRPDIAAPLFARLADADRQRRGDWFAQAGQWYLAANDPLAAARVYRQASLFATAQDTARDYSLAALQAFQSAAANQQALAQARRLVELAPADPSHRETLAQLAEWTDNPTLALTARLWLARRNPSGSQTRHALALARELNDDTAQIELFTLLATQRPLSDDEIAAVASAFSRTDNTAASVEFFADYRNRYPEHASGWETLATLQETTGDLRGAADTWHQIGLKFDRQPDATLRRSTLYWTLDLREDALALLTALQPDVDPDQTNFWRLLGDQAWQLTRSPLATAAYHVLWTAGEADVAAAERLILLLRDGGDTERATAIAATAFEQLGEPRLLLLGMDAAVRAHHWEAHTQLLNMAHREPAKFENVEMYWLQRALSSTHHQQVAKAVNHYERALSIAPQSNAARLGLLWLAIDNGDNRALPALLQRWRIDAETDPAFWQVYAVALTQLGLIRQALPWHHRLAQSNPTDTAVLLNYAQALAHSGQHEAARRLRHHAVSQLRPSMVAAAQP